MSQTQAQPTDARERVIASASRLGVQLNEAELERWMSAVTTTSAGASEGEDVVMDERTGVFGHKISMLDFDPQQLARFRAIGKIVEFEDIAGHVETALALSGSAAQSKIQTYPGDCDFFERVNIIAPTRAEACQTLARIIREKVLTTMSGPNYQFIEAKFGNFPQEVRHADRTYRKGSPIAWLPDDVVAGQIAATDLRGNPLFITWESVMNALGWCKLDWVIA